MTNEGFALLEEKEKPQNIDQLLKQMLLEKPELMAELKKSIPASDKPAQEKQPREKKAPGKDFFLLVYSGCETCHAITQTTYSMQWDSIAGLYRPRIFKNSMNLENSELKVQLITSRTCVSCYTQLASIGLEELVKLYIKQRDPEAEIIRLVQLKKALKEVSSK